MNGTSLSHIKFQLMQKKNGHRESLGEHHIITATEKIKCWILKSVSKFQERQNMYVIPHSPAQSPFNYKGKVVTSQ